MKLLLFPIGILSLLFSSLSYPSDQNPLTLPPPSMPPGHPQNSQPPLQRRHKNNVLGTQAIFSPQWKSYRIAPFAGHDYGEPGYDMLKELREGVALTGISQFKFKLSSNACASYRINNTRPTSLTELSRVPEIAATLADPRFAWYHIWMYSFANPKPFKVDIHDTAAWEREYQETYHWAKHVLEVYQNTGKVFFVGNWEGDWELLWASGCRNEEGGFQKDCVPSETILERYRKWANTRKRAIQQAKQDLKELKGVDIFFYVEFNLGDENYEEFAGQPRPTILNSVVPAVNPDFLSYSSYKSTNRYKNHATNPSFHADKVDRAFWKLLDYAQDKLGPADTDLSVVLGPSAPGDVPRRVFVGEFGPPRQQNKNNKYQLDQQDEEGHAITVAYVVKAAMAWGCPFVLDWEIYDNDSNMTPLVPRGTSKLSDRGPLRKLFCEWNQAANQYYEEHHAETSYTKDFQTWGVAWFANRIAQYKT